MLKRPIESLIKMKMSESEQFHSKTVSYLHRSLVRIYSSEPSQICINSGNRNKPENNIEPHFEHKQLHFGHKPIL